METIKRGPGRPQALAPGERRARILEAAAQLFIEDGYESTNMERVAQRCGMSKKTLYQNFDSKDTLFAALVCDVEQYEDSSVSPSPGQSLSQVLLQLAQWVLAPRQIGLTRLVIAGAPSIPDVAARFREHAVERGRRMIRECLARSQPHHHERQELKDGELEALASMVFGAAIADLQLRALIGEDISAASETAALTDRIHTVARLVSSRLAAT